MTSDDFNVDTLRALHLALLQPRLIEEKMLRLLRQGRLSKWFSGIGQEAIAVGVGRARRKERRHLGTRYARLEGLEQPVVGAAGDPDLREVGRAHAAGIDTVTVRASRARHRPGSADGPETPPLPVRSG